MFKDVYLSWLESPDVHPCKIVPLGSSLVLSDMQTNNTKCNYIWLMDNTRCSFLSKIVPVAQHHV